MAKKKQKKEDGRRLWKTVSDSVTPISGREREYTPFQELFEASEQAPAPCGPVSKSKAPRKPVTPTAVNRQPLPVQPKMQTLSHGESDGLDKRSAERLKKGRMAVDAKIDLHGMSQEQAHRALNAFVEAAYMTQKRCVQVVTGKGRGILQQAVPHWLNQMPLRARIISFTYTPQNQGGTGALYVLIKRQRGLR